MRGPSCRWHSRRQRAAAEGDTVGRARCARPWCRHESPHLRLPACSVNMALLRAAGSARHPGACAAARQALQDCFPDLRRALRCNTSGDAGLAASRRRRRRCCRRAGGPPLRACAAWAVTAVGGPIGLPHPDMRGINLGCMAAPSPALLNSSTAATPELFCRTCRPGQHDSARCCPHGAAYMAALRRPSKVFVVG